MTTEYAGVLAIILGGVVLACASFKAIPSSLDPLDSALVHRERASKDPSSSSQSPTARATRRPSLRPALITGAFALAVALIALKVGRRIRIDQDESEDAAEEVVAVEPDSKRYQHRDKRLGILRSLSKLEGLSKGELAVGHFMTRNLIHVTPDCAREELEELVWKHHIRHVLVLAGEQLVGIISDRDLLSRDGSRASEIMTGSLVTITPETRACTAVSLMLERHVSCLPVLDAEAVVGLVTTVDIMMALQCVLRLVDQITEDLPMENAEPPVA